MNKCFDCFYGLPSRCPYMFDKTKKFKGMKITTQGVVYDCPKFIPAALTSLTVAGIIGMSSRNLCRISVEEIEKRLLKEGWRVKGFRSANKTYWAVKAKTKEASLQPKKIIEEPLDENNKKES